MAHVMKNVETERKFLVRDSSYKSQAVKSFRIKQGYIAHDGGNTVRVRIRDHQGFLTIKGPSYDGISRFEWEREISLEDAEALCSLCHGGFIDKTRYIVPAGDDSCSADNYADATQELSPACTKESADEDFCEASAFFSAKQKSSSADSHKYFEVDEFYGDNKGLVVAEIELEKPDEPFDRPAWLGEEVTGDRRYYNSHLLRYPFKSWK